MTGIGDYQVFPYNPRDPELRGMVPFSVRGEGVFSVDVIRKRDQQAVASQTWQVGRQVATLAPTRFDQEGGLIRTSSSTLTVDNVKIGGPYILRFTHEGQVESYDNVLVGEIWVVGGGSNAIGAPGTPRSVDPNVHMFRDEKWQPAAEPLFTWHDPGTLEPLPSGSGPISPWLAAAQTYYLNSGIPVGVLGVAYQDRPIAQFWYESSDTRSTGKVYDLTGFDTLVPSQARGASVFCWYQGEADATAAGCVYYGEHLKAVVAAMRRYTQNPDMLALIVQLSYKEPPSLPPYFGRIRDLQRRFCMEDPRSILVPALPFAHRDGTHLDENGILRLGDSIGQALKEVYDRKRIVWPGPRPISAHFTDFQRRGIRMVFDSLEPINVLRGAEGHWSIEDGEHLGYPAASPPFYKSGELVTKVTGAKVLSTQVDEATQEVKIRVQKEGYVSVMRVTRLGQTSIQLSLASPAMMGATVSYGLMDDCRGSLRTDSGKSAATFLDFPIQEPEGAAGGFSQ